MVYLNWGHTSTPSKLEAYLRFNWNRSCQHIQWSLHPQIKDSQSATSLSFQLNAVLLWAVEAIPASAVCCRRSNECCIRVLECRALCGRAQAWRNSRFSDLERQFNNLLEMPLPFYRPKSTGRGKTICCFVGQYTCHALGKGIDKAKCEQRLSCLGAGGRVWLCFVPVANNSDGADFPACSGWDKQPKKHQSEWVFFDQHWREFVFFLHLPNDTLTWMTGLWQGCLENVSGKMQKKSKYFYKC